jgi:UDP-N-acetylmuramoyl-tripeptide--D-alanyl-D-alanine ligase
LHNGIIFINDAYNANPLSMRASLTTFAQLPCEGRRFAVLGGMRELGGTAEDEHRELGLFVDTLKLDGVITIGEAGVQMVCDGITGVDKTTAVDILRTHLRTGDAVLFKASRGERLETVLDELKTRI